MSTPIETNTEQLQEVLQQVYNLPNRSASSDSYDLEIEVSLSWHTDDRTTIQELSDLSYSAEDVKKVVEKLLRGEEPKVIVKGTMEQDSGGLNQIYIHPDTVFGSSWEDGNAFSVSVVCVTSNSYYQGVLSFVFFANDSTNYKVNSYMEYNSIART